MGNRACILIKQNVKDNGVFLYTHWNADSISNTIKTALKKYWRWNDAPYLTRIVFDVMTKDNHDTEIDFGISDHQINGKLFTIVCDDKIIIDNDNTTFSFEDFIK